MKEDYNNYLVNRNRKICVQERNAEVYGTARGITNTGKLCVELENGEEKEIFAGEVSVRGIYGYV